MAVRGRPGPSFPRQPLGARPPQRAGIGCGPGEGGEGSGRAQARCCYCSVVPPGGCLAPGAAPCPRAAAMPVSPAAMPRPSGVAAAAAGLGGTRCDRPWCRPVPAFLGPSLTGAAAPGGGGGRAGVRRPRARLRRGMGDGGRRVPSCQAERGRWGEGLWVGGCRGGGVPRQRRPLGGVVVCQTRPGGDGRRLASPHGRVWSRPPTPPPVAVRRHTAPAGEAAGRRRKVGVWPGLWSGSGGLRAGVLSSGRLRMTARWRGSVWLISLIL